MRRRIWSPFLGLEDSDLNIFYIFGQKKWLKIYLGGFVGAACWRAEREDAREEREEEDWGVKKHLNFNSCFVLASQNGHCTRVFHMWQPNFTMSAKFHKFGKISQYWKSWNTCVLLVYLCILEYLELGQFRNFCDVSYFCPFSYCLIIIPTHDHVTIIT